MPNVVAWLYHDLTSPTTNPPEWVLNGNNWIIIFTAVLVPLCFLRDLNSLRHASYIALFSVAYLVVVVIRGYILPFKDMPAPGEICLIHFTADFVSTFPVQVFASTCAQNLFPIYNEMKSNAQTRMNIVIPYLKHGSLVQFLKRVSMHQNREPEDLGRIAERLKMSTSRSSYGNFHRTVLKAGDVHRILQEVAQGMEYLHQNDTLHGDLKAANILVDDNYRCVISDFGQSEMKSEVLARG